MIIVARQNVTILFLLLMSCLMSWSSASTSSDLDLTDHERQWLQQHTNISVAFDGYFPPYSFLNDQGELEGFAVDVFGLIEERLGIRFTHHDQYDWSELYQSAQERQVDVVATMVQRPERLQHFIFTEPYIYKSLMIMTRQGDDQIHQRDDIQGKKVALVENYQYVKRIIETYPTIEPFYTNTMLDALNAVAIGEADAAITFLGAGHYFRTKYLLSNLDYAAIYDKDTSNESIAVRNDWPELKSILEKALASISEQTLLELQARWLPDDYDDILTTIDFTPAEVAWLKANPAIRLGVDPEFAPFEFIEEGAYRGLASDYIDILSRRLGLTMTVVPDLSWQDVIQGAKIKQIDVLPAVGFSEERDGYLNFTEPYLSFHRVIVMQEDAPFVSGLRDLRRARIGVQANTSHHAYLNEHTTIKPFLYDTLHEALLAVSGGEVDAFVGNVAASTYWIRQYNLNNLKIAAPVSTDVQHLHFAVRDDWPELVSILQKGLDSISPARRSEIAARWLSIEYTPIRDLTLLYRTAEVFAVILIAVLLWIYLLRRQIKIRTQQLEYSSNYDGLTDLPNRFLITDRLRQAISEHQHDQRKLAVLSIDIEKFKQVNDAFGHKTGDLLLRHVAIRLKAVVRDSYAIGRITGGHFSIFLRDIREVSDAAVKADQILSSLEKPFHLDGQDVPIQAFIGIAVFPDDGDAAEDLMRHADTASHARDANDMDRYAFFTESLEQGVAHRIKLEHRMRDALQNQEFSVHFQPKIATDTQQVISFEALVRWQNAELGQVSPAEFIPIAESNGLIETIGLYVLKDSLAVLQTLMQRYERPFTMAVNLSPVQLRNASFISQVASLLMDSGVDGSRLEFEITEGVLLSGYDKLGERLQQLHSLGTRLAMDDFGTGYSSLNYLRKYHFDVVKIDRDFIADMVTDESDQRLVNATIAMAHSMGLTVVAEGVETDAQSALLSAQSCDLLQGWLISKALPVNELIAFLDTHFSYTAPTAPSN